MQRIKYDPDAWLDIAANKEAPVPAESQVRLAKPGTLSVKWAGEWRLLGYGTEFKISLPGPAVVKADVAFAVFISVDVAVHSKGVPLTNMEKRPGDSAVERMVKKALLEQKLASRAAAERRRAADKQLAKKRFEAGLEDEQRLVDPPPNVGEEPVVDDTATEPSTV